MATYSIDSESFLLLQNRSNASGAPELSGEALSVFQRAGIDGASVRRDGKKTRPFQMFGRVDVQSAAAALTKLDSYRDLRGTQVVVVWQDLDYSGPTLSHEFIVLDVQASFRAIGTNVGGLSGTNATHLVESTWILLPVDTS